MYRHCTSTICAGDSMLKLEGEGIFLVFFFKRCCDTAPGTTRTSKTMADSPEKLIHQSQIIRRAAEATGDSAATKDVKRRAQLCVSLVEHCRSDEGWKVASDKKNSSLRIMYQHEDKSVHRMKYSAVFDCTVPSVLAIAREFDLISGWNKHVKDSAVLAAPSQLQLVAYGSVFFPWYEDHFCHEKV